MAILLAAMGGVEVYAVLALIPILLYNGREGQADESDAVWFLYLLSGPSAFNGCCYTIFSSCEGEEDFGGKSPM